MGVKAGPVVVGERQALLVVANPDQWFARSLDTVLTGAGYGVVSITPRAPTSAQIARHRPDAVILDATLAGPEYRLCRALRAEAAISLVTPIVLTTPATATRSQHLDALRAGAWELCGAPLDTEALVLRLGVYVQAKLQADRLGAEGLVDHKSGLYNRDGMTRRAQEIAALTGRQGLPLSCAVFRPADAGADGEAGDRLARAFKASARISDVVCRVGEDEFTVFAPATDQAGAARLVARLADAVGRALTGSPIALRSGYSAGASPPHAPPDPLALLARARTALGTGRPA